MRFALVGAAVLASLLSVSTAVALVDSPTPSRVAVELLCTSVESCASLPSVSGPDDTPLVFDYGTRVVQDGFDLTLETSGNIYIMGPVRASDLITIKAQGGTIAVGRGTLDAPTISLYADSADSKGELAVPDLPPIVPGTRPPNHPICACIEALPGFEGGVLSSGDITLGDRGNIRLSAGRIEVAAVTAFEPSGKEGTGATAEPFVPGLLAFDREGDIYLDVSMVELGKLFLKAGKSVIIEDIDSTYVPEPGTALLLGGGLATLSAFRRRA